MYLPYLSYLLLSGDKQIESQDWEDKTLCGEQSALSLSLCYHPCNSLLRSFSAFLKLSQLLALGGHSLL
jgi:hypothetical protein